MVGGNKCPSNILGGQSQLKPEVMSELSAIYGPDVLDRLTLVCYEKPSEFCHRHLVADWLTQHGADISERKFNELPNIIDDVLDLM